MKSFLAFPIDEYFLAKDEIISEGQLRWRIRSMSRSRDSHCKCASLDKGIDVFTPVGFEDCGSKLLSEHTEDTFNDSVCLWILHCRRLWFDSIALQQFLKLDAHEFISIVVNAFQRTRVTTEPLLIESFGSGDGRSGRDPSNLAPVCTSVDHSNDVNLELDNLVRVLMLVANCPWTATINVDCLPGLFVPQTRNERQLSVSLLV